MKVQVPIRSYRPHKQVRSLNYYWLTELQSIEEFITKINNWCYQNANKAVDS